MNEAYERIVDLPHHVSDKHPRMPLLNRAAQFAPFAALTGYGAAIDETGRRTAERRELDEHEKATLDEALRGVQSRIADAPTVTIVCFEPDAKKSGGAYVTLTGTVRRIDAYERAVVLTDGRAIPIDDIVALSEERTDAEQTD